MVRRDRSMAPVSLENLRGRIAPEVIDAAKTASRQLTQLGIRHALIGGIAVGAHGHPRATDDVDFLVGKEAFEFHEDGLVTFKPGVPLRVGNVAIDELGLEPSEGFLQDALDHPEDAGGVPAVPIEVLVYLKLKAGRLQDMADVEALMNRGMDVGTVRAWLARNASSQIVERFDRLAKT